MTTVADVTAWLEGFAPSHLAEPWDNVGLLWGDPSATVEKVMTCLTVTPATASEAIREGAALILSHHPVLFRETRRIRADRAETGHLWSLARAGIAIASPHTAFDNTRDGINELLCRVLGIRDAKVLRPFEPARGASTGAGPASFKVVVFTPESDRENVMEAAFAAGAGIIGAYRECSFAIPGEGTFYGTESSDPSVGQKGRRERVPELRIEFVCPAERLASVMVSVRDRHSYEEPAIDVYPLHSPVSPGTGAAPAGAGRVGDLEEAMSLRHFALEVGRILRSECVQVVGARDAHRTTGGGGLRGGRRFSQRRRPGRSGRAADRRGEVSPRRRGRGAGTRVDRGRPPCDRADRCRGPGRPGRRSVPGASRSGPVATSATPSSLHGREKENPRWVPRGLNGSSRPETRVAVPGATGWANRRRGSALLLRFRG